MRPVLVAFRSVRWLFSKLASQPGRNEAVDVELNVAL
jgi:hypothetical protein